LYLHHQRCFCTDAMVMQPETLPLAQEHCLHK